MIADMIDGENVRLRPIEENDLSLLQQWANDASLMRFWATTSPLATEHQFEGDLKGRFAMLESAGYFMIEDTDRNAIGRIEFERLSDRERSAEVMILIGQENARCKGYGSDAMIALLRYLFHQRDLHRVWLTVLAWNQPAIRSYEKVGFTREGILRDDLYFEGAAHDQIVMSLLRPEYDAKWASPPVESMS